MSDVDIHFGDLEESEPDRSLRPDRNKHFAVAAYEEPQEDELPVFLDLDVMRDMEVHALSDTSVELGGVLLGGQFEDEDGKPFVVISDSLRAEHYESTKGSFKFTHDTWSKISREREEFPDDLQMVGWYHTHPDWGVFLSGMDMFICDNFFNKPLDVAYVIDPCRQDRAFFEWTGNAGQRIRRVGGFYVTASRFRRQELEYYVAQLEGGLDMSSQQFGPGPPAVVHIHDQRQSWQGVAVLGMLSIQFLFLLLISWKMFGSGEQKETKKRGDTDLAARLAVQDEVMRTVVETAAGGKSGLTNKLKKTAKDNIQLQSQLVAMRVQSEKLIKERKKSDEAASEFKKELESVKKEKESIDKKRKELLDKNSELKKKLQGSDNEGGVTAFWKKWLFPVGIGAIVGLLVIAGYSATVSMKGPESDEDAGPEAGDEETPVAAESQEEDNDTGESPPLTRP